MGRVLGVTAVWVVLLLTNESLGSVASRKYFARGLARAKQNVLMIPITDASSSTAPPTSSSSATTSTAPASLAMLGSSTSVSTSRTATTGGGGAPATATAATAPAGEVAGSATRATTSAAKATATMTSVTTPVKNHSGGKIGSGKNEHGQVASSTEKTSSRTMSTTGDSIGFVVSSTRKPSTIAEAAMVSTLSSTASSTSAKETRESPGKIRPQIKLTTNYTSASETGVRLPEGASAALAKPTKYHYYPHNQHIYLLPECAVQQVCNAVYVRLNFTQPLCACPGRYRDPCSASLDSDDLHTTELVTDPRTKALTLVKTCEPVAEMRECRVPRDWSLLALQNVRTGKSHYLVICRCPDTNILEGPMSHDQPTYASVPGIRVYGMMCVQGNRRGRPLRQARSLATNFLENFRSIRTSSSEDKESLDFPWHKVSQLLKTSVWD